MNAPGLTSPPGEFARPAVCDVRNVFTFPALCDSVLLMDNATMIKEYELVARANRANDWDKFLEESCDDPVAIAYEVEELNPLRLDEDVLGARFQTLVKDVTVWLERHRSAKPLSGVMTCEDVIRALSLFPPDMPVLMDDGEGWWTYIKELHLPLPDGGVGDGGEYMRPSFEPGACWDSRDS